MAFFNNLLVRPSPFSTAAHRVTKPEGAIMLQAIRDRITGIIAIIILGLLALPFALVGIQGYFTGGGQNLVAEIEMPGLGLTGSDDIQITIQEYQSQFSNYRRRLQRQLGDNYAPELFDTPVARREFLENLIDERLLRAYALDGGMDMARTQLAEAISAIPAFQVAGRFDPQVYQLALRQQGLTPKLFESQIRDSGIVQDLAGALTGSGFATAAEIDRALELNGETLDVAFFTIPAARYRDQATVDEDKIAAYYDEHRTEFMTEEQVSLAYLEVDAANFIDEIEVSDDELRARYEQNRERFGAGERRLASHILLTLPETDGDEAEAAAEETVRRQAEDIAQRARNGEDFAELAKAYSADPGSAENGGDLGWIEPGVMVTPFEDALFALAAGDISAPVKTGFGYHVIKLREIEGSRQKPFEEVKGELRQELIDERTEWRYQEAVDRLATITYEDNGSLDGAAEELDLEIKTTPPFGRGGGSDIAAHPEVLKAAFSDEVLNQRLNSDPLELATGRTVVVRINEHRPAEQRSLEMVSDEIKGILQQLEQRRLARQAAETWLAQIEAGELTLDEAAASIDATVTENSAIGRNDFQLGAAFLDELFALPVRRDESGQVVTTYHLAARTPTDTALVALRGRRLGAVEGAEAARREQLEREIVNRQAPAEYQALLAALRRHYKVTVYDDRL